ncbi:hypothetical protein BASA82_000653 [Batrachochytrium salamandrivorans]|nr:hypothetical protein BASA82_000653 [Batrachochytrium salamandrivorans]
MDPICNFIRKTARRLKLQLSTTCTAQVLFHRFSHCQSLQDHDPVDVALACVFLASKVEEDVVQIDALLDCARDALSLPSPTTTTEQQQLNVLLYERIVLNTLNYQVMVEHPFDCAIKFVKVLTTGYSDDEELLFLCVRNILNDSFGTKMCLHHKPRLMAAAAVCLASQMLAKPGKRFPEILQSFERRNDIFGFPPSELRPVQEELVTLYEGVI